MIRDLTEGRPFRVLLLFSLPMFFSMLFQQIYNLADSLIAGRFISEAALGAVGTCYPVTVIFIAIASGLSLGANTAAARAFGGKDWKELRQMIPTALLFMLLLSAAVMAAGLFACGPLLDLLQIPSDLREMCEVYLRIYLFGLPFLFLYNMAGSLFQALGDSRTPWRFLAAASVLNVLLDLLFAAVLNMGIPGTAWGTFLAQGFSAVGSCAALLRPFRRRILPEGAGRLVRWKYAGIILKLGIPSVLQQVFISLGQLSLQSVINPYGSGAVAGYTAAFRINTLFVTTTMTLSNALSSFVSQNLGAKKTERVRAGVGLALLISEGITLLILAVCLLFREPLIRLFVTEGASRETLETGTLFLTVAAPFFPVCCLKNTMDGALRGMGAMKCFMAATFADILVRIFLGAPFSARYGLGGVFWVWPAAWCVGTALSVLFYFWQGKKIKDSL